jgi:alginate O-acetyltransferase complex protein AlgI
MGYYLLKKNYRIYFLLFASLFFYAWGEPLYILVMLLSIIINYIFGLLLHVNAEKNRTSKLVLLIAVVCNIGILFYFKYLNFTVSTINRIFSTDFVYHNIVMPIGISFFTFQGMSYVIDLYYKKVKVQKNPALVAFYISFFPQLIAGPIVRYIDIEKQIYSRNISVDKFAEGATRFVFGLAKKVIIANNLGYTVDSIFANPAIENTAATAWLGIICYTFQIFFDFSGYSDMAIGLGKIFGFDFLENFNYPYVSKSITEFWRRWHISLSSWFRDYVYIPLGGNRRGNVYVNLFIVFVLTGFWHGAGFGFLAWGLWHGFFLIVERLFGIKEVKKAFIPLKYILTMLIVVVGWVFFRSPGLRYAVSYLGVMFCFIKGEDFSMTVWFYLNHKVFLVLLLAGVASTPLLDLEKSNFKYNMAYKHVRNVLTLILLFVSMVFVVSSSYNPFIYFRF